MALICDTPSSRTLRNTLKSLDNGVQGQTSVPTQFEEGLEVFGRDPDQAAKAMRYQLATGNPAAHLLLRALADPGDLIDP